MYKSTRRMLNAKIKTTGNPLYVIIGTQILLLALVKKCITNTATK